MTHYKVTKTVQIKAPIESVFRTISDPANLLRLNLMPEDSLIKLKHVEKITKGPMGTGSVWHFKGSFHRLAVEYDEQVIIWDPPRRLVTEQIGGPFKTIRWEHLLAPVRSGTSETHTVEYVPPDSLQKSVDRRRLRKHISESMETATGRLKVFLEERQGRRGRCGER